MTPFMKTPLLITLATALGLPLASAQEDRRPETPNGVRTAIVLCPISRSARVNPMPDARLILMAHAALTASATPKVAVPKRSVPMGRDRKGTDVMAHARKPNVVMASGRRAIAAKAHSLKPNAVATRAPRGSVSAKSASVRLRLRRARKGRCRTSAL